MNSSGNMKPKGNLTPYQLAVELQSMREEMNEKNKNIVNSTNLRINSDMITLLPLIKKIKNSNEFLHNRPEINQNCSTCVLENGTRFFLRKRKNIYGGRGDVNVNNLKKSNVDSRSKDGNLLSKSMVELLRESENINIQNLTRKRTLETYNSDNSNGIREEYKMKGEVKNNKNGEINENNDFTIFEKSLWVDKYSPKSFSQLLSPEKINREVLKALKAWDSYVFNDEKKEIKKDNYHSSTRFSLQSNNANNHINDNVVKNHEDSVQKRKKKSSALVGREGEGDEDNEQETEDSSETTNHKQVRTCKIIDFLQFL